MTMNKVICSNCEAEAKIKRGDYQFEETGLLVNIVGLDIIYCEVCGNEDPIIPHMNDLMRLLAAIVVSKPERLVGAEIRFLRKYLRMSGEEFSKLLDLDKTHLSKLENDADPIGPQSDRLVRMMAMVLGEGLKERMEDVIRDLPRTRKDKKFRRAKNRPIKVDPKEMTGEYV
jgi:DNA-binding transcriptional regulator YiaG